MQAIQRRAKIKNEEKSRDRHLLKHFGISLDEYKEILKAQGGVCAICQRPERVKMGDKTIALAVDHDHGTGKVRDLLCLACNRRVGLIESPFLFTSIVEYLKKHRSSSLNEWKRVLYE